MKQWKILAEYRSLRRRFEVILLEQTLIGPLLPACRRGEKVYLMFPSLVAYLIWSQMALNMSSVDLRCLMSKSCKYDHMVAFFRNAPFKPNQKGPERCWRGGLRWCADLGSIIRTCSLDHCMRPMHRGAFLHAILTPYASSSCVCS